MTEYVTVWQEGKPTTLRWAAPVVRCRDCRHLVSFSEPPRMYCGVRHHLYAVEPDGYCKWGERRDA